jgi:hypothetical protein
MRFFAEIFDEWEGQSATFSELEVPFNPSPPAARGNFQLAACDFFAQVWRMAGLRLLSKIEQVAAHLRVELAGGRWEGTMPGRVELAAELRMNDRTVEQALRLLEREGVLVPQGAGRRRLIALVVIIAVLVLLVVLVVRACGGPDSSEASSAVLAAVAKDWCLSPFEAAL